MWAAGYNVQRVLVAGAGELGRQVAETITAHRELGYRLAGFVDDDPARAAGSGLPVLGSLEQTTQVAAAHGVDQLYIALPLDEHAKLLKLIKSVSNECLDIKVVPDLVQYATIKAALEDLDGIPIISLTEVPLRGWNSMVKRVMDVVLASTALFILTFVVPLFPVVAAPDPPAGRQGPDPAPPGADDPRRQDIPALQVPHDGGRGRAGHRPHLGERRRPAPHGRSASGCAGGTSTSSPSSSTWCWAT